MSSDNASIEAQLKARQEQFGVDYIARFENVSSPYALQACFEQTMADLAKIRNSSDDASIEAQLKARQEQFGVDYIALFENVSSPYALQACVEQTMADLAKIRNKNTAAAASTAAAAVTYGPDETEASIEDEQSEDSEESAPSIEDDEPSDHNSNYDSSTILVSEGDQSFSGGSDSDSSSGESSIDGTSSRSAWSNISEDGTRSEVPSTNAPTHKKEVSRAAPPEVPPPPKGAAPPKARPENGNRAIARAAPSTEPPGKRPISRDKTRTISKGKPKDGFQGGDEEHPFEDSNPYQWRMNEFSFSGKTRFESKGKEEKIQGKSIAGGIEHFKANPIEYVAMLYQTSMLTEKWPAGQCEYIYVHREGTRMYQPVGISETKGWMTVWLQEYEALPSYEADILPKRYRDEWTDDMTFKGHRIHSDSNPPILPGRGMGICDAPNIKVR
jgi:hypothetical protein